MRKAQRHHHVTVNSEARADLNAWSKFIEKFNGEQFFLSENWVSSDRLCLYSDSLHGYASAF